MMTRFLLFLFVSIAVTLSAATPPTSLPRPTGKAGKRISLIEKEFGLVWTGVMTVASKDGTETPYWTFGRPVLDAPFGIVVVGVPSKPFATDQQIIDAFACSMIYAKFCKIAADHGAQPTPSPTPAAFELRTVYSF